MRQRNNNTVIAFLFYKFSSLSEDGKSRRVCTIYEISVLFIAPIVFPKGNFSIANFEKAIDGDLYPVTIN